VNWLYGIGGILFGGVVVAGIAVAAFVYIFWPLTMNPPTRVYSSGEISVEWRAELCIHCENCFRGLPQVFDPTKRPWVNINGASSEEIKRQVGDCPSGALSIA
jgi:uncharacterized Fe-S cluster protein YjdI